MAEKEMALQIVVFCLTFFRLHACDIVVETDLFDNAK